MVFDWPLASPSIVWSRIERQEGLVNGVRRGFSRTLPRAEPQLKRLHSAEWQGWLKELVPTCPMSIRICFPQLPAYWSYWSWLVDPGQLPLCSPSVKKYNPCSGDKVTVLQLQSWQWRWCRIHAKSCGHTYYIISIICEIMNHNSNNDITGNLWESDV